MQAQVQVQAQVQEQKASMRPAACAAPLPPALRSVHLRRLAPSAHASHSLVPRTTRPPALAASAVVAPAAYDRHRLLRAVAAGRCCRVLPPLPCRCPRAVAAACPQATLAREGERPDGAAVVVADGGGEREGAGEGPAAEVPAEVPAATAVVTAVDGGRRRPVANDGRRGCGWEAGRQGGRRRGGGDGGDGTHSTHKFKYHLTVSPKQGADAPT